MWMGKSRYSWFSYSSSSLEGTGKFSSVSCLSLAPLPSGDRTGFGSIQEQCNLPSLSSFRVAPLTVLHISSANLVSESFNSIIFLMAWSPLWALTRLSWLMVSRWEWPGGCLGKKCCAWPTKPHLSVPLPDSHPMYCSLPHLRTPLCKLSHIQWEVIQGVSVHILLSRPVLEMEPEILEFPKPPMTDSVELRCTLDIGQWVVVQVIPKLLYFSVWGTPVFRIADNNYIQLVSVSLNHIQWLSMPRGCLVFLPHAGIWAFPCLVWSSL